jgi:hypothetical protein
VDVTTIEQAARAMEGLLRSIYNLDYIDELREDIIKDIKAHSV